MKGANVKKYAAAFVSAVILALSLVSCADRTVFSPAVSLSEGYVLSGNTISAHFYNLDSVDIYSDVKFSSGVATLYSDSSFSEYLSEGLLELCDGENIFYFLVRNGRKSVTYKLMIEDTFFDALSVKLISDRIYRIGESFDRSTVEVSAELINGKTKIIDDYSVVSAFDGEGEHEVKISCGGYVSTVKVTVKGEQPYSLDKDLRDISGARYSLSEGAAVLLSGSEVSGYYVVPRSVTFGGKPYPVSAVSDHCFYENSNLTGISIPDSVISVGECAFEGCSALANASFSGETLLSGYLFRDCKSLINVKLPAGLSGIPDGLFSGCSALPEIFIPDGAEYIGSQAYLDCAALGTAILPQSIKTIGARAFKGCSELRRIVCGTSVELVGDGAFSYCKSLLTAVLPEFAESERGLFTGSPLATLYSGKSSMAMYYAAKDGIKTKTLEKNGLTVAEYRSEYVIGEEFDTDSFVALIMKDDYLGLAENFFFEYDFSFPGLRRVYVNGSESKAVLDVFVSYTETLSGTLDSRGAEYALDYETLTAALVNVPESLNAGLYADASTFILPTSVSDGDNAFAVTSVSSGAIKSRSLRRLFIHSGVKLIEDDAITDSPSLSLICCGVRTGTMLKIGSGNFTSLSDSLLVLCEFRNSVMQSYARSNGIRYAGTDTETLYFIPGRGAKTFYSENDEFSPDGFYITYIGKNFSVTELSQDDVTFAYDFSSSSVVTATALGKSAECIVNIT